MLNLFKELESVLISNNLQVMDIVWVGTASYKIPILPFLERCREVYYDQQAGSTEVAIDLIIAGSDWFIRRSRSHDGSERWEFIKLPTEPNVERMDITNFTIRECLDAKGFRKHTGSKFLKELNTLDEPESPETPEKPSK